MTELRSEAAAPVDIDTWEIIDGRLVLQFSDAFKKIFEQDRAGNIQKANEKWRRPFRVVGRGPRPTKPLVCYRYVLLPGLRHQPGPRLAGEGAYALARHGHDSHVHLAYALRPSARTSEVREDLRIAREASYIVSVFASSVDRPPRGRDRDDGRRRFLPLEPRQLDVPGTEVVLIGAGDVLIADLGTRLDPAAEDETTAELSVLVRDASGRPASAPLLEGIWH